MQTSYIAKVRSMPEEDKQRCISICYIRSNLAKAKCFLPSSQLLNDYKQSTQTKEEQIKYIHRYIEETLSLLDPEKILKEYDNTILLCCDGIDKFCHRRVIAMWLKYHTGVYVEEYDIPANAEIDQFIYDTVRDYYVKITL